MPAFYYSIGARYYKCERFTITMEVLWVLLICLEFVEILLIVELALGVS